MSENNNLGISIAIVIAAIIIGGALIFTNKNDGSTNNGTNTEKVSENTNDDLPKDAKNISPVTASDHIRGDINAPIKIVEYSDMECPYCIRLHTTLLQLMEENKDAPVKIAWVYRHMPLTQLHPKALTEAIATECVATLGGEEKFFTYLDKIYANTPGNNQLDLSLLPKYAVEVGVNQADFEKCLADEASLEKIKKQIAEGFSAGAEGTPFSVIITPEGEYKPVAGALPIEVWREIIDSVSK